MREAHAERLTARLLRADAARMACLHAARDIALAVKVLGITAYRYELTNREVWSGQRLVALDSKTNDDGTSDFAKVSTSGDALKISGSRYSGGAPAGVGTTSYFATGMHARKTWISTQSGNLMNVRVSAEGRPNWWRVTGDLTTTLGYDANGEWVGCEFDAGGEPGTYEVISGNGRIAQLWSDA